MLLFALYLAFFFNLWKIYFFYLFNYLLLLRFFIFNHFFGLLCYCLKRFLLIFCILFWFYTFFWLIILNTILIWLITIFTLSFWNLRFEFFDFRHFDFQLLSLHWIIFIYALYLEMITFLLSWTSFASIAGWKFFWFKLLLKIECWNIFLLNLNDLIYFVSAYTLISFLYIILYLLF